MAADSQSLEPGGLSHQLDLLGKFADNVAHEMNNVLAAIMGLASVLASELGPENPLARDVEGIQEASKRGLELMRNLFSFADQGYLPLEPVSVNEVVGMVRSLLLRTTPNQVEIQLKLGEDVPLVDGNLAQLKQALFNLGLNGVEACGKRGSVTLTTECVRVTEETDSPLPRGNYVRVNVTDTGSGMPPDTLNRAFQPFFSTKTERGAAGLGLPLASRIIERHGGEITLFSKPKLGTTVSVYLPGAAVQTATKAEPGGDVIDIVEQKTVLVVDDDKLVLQGATRLLGTLGYEAVPARSGDQALQIFDEKKDEIDVVLLDLVMPGRDGAEVLRELRAMDPKVRVVVSSGYPMEGRDRALKKLGAAAFVRKPFSTEELVRTLEGVLSGA